MAKLFKIHNSQVLPTDIDRAWDFISSPQNLKTITPENMDFRIANGEGNPEMYAGQIIEYKIRPVLNISLTTSCPCSWP